MKKKILAALLAGAMTLGLAGCGGAAPADAGSASASEAAAESTAAEPAAEEAASASAAEGEAVEYKVGIVKFMDHPSLNQIESNIMKALDELNSDTVIYNYADYTFDGQGDGSVINQIVAQLISDEVDVIIPIATPAAQIAQAACEDHPIPIVFSAVSDPVSAALVESMEAPGANITGTSDYLNTQALLDLMFAADPDIDCVGLLYSNSEDASKVPIAEAEKYLEEKNIRIVSKTGTTTDEVSQAVDALIAEKVDAVFTPTDNTIQNAELAIYEKLAEAGIPHYAGADSFALNGGFCGFGVDYAQLGRETGLLAAEILGGADPAVTSVKTFENGIATINTDTCSAIGYNLDEVEAAFEPYVTEIVLTTTSQEFEE